MSKLKEMQKKVNTLTVNDVCVEKDSPNSVNFKPNSPESEDVYDASKKTISSIHPTKPSARTVKAAETINEYHDPNDIIHCRMQRLQLKHQLNVAHRKHRESRQKADCYRSKEKAVRMMEEAVGTAAMKHAQTEEKHFEIE